MHLDTQQQRTIRSAGRWGIAVVLVCVLEFVVGLAHLFDGSLRDIILTAVGLAIVAWQALGLAVAALAFGGRPSAERFEAGLSGLRTFAKVGVLALPVFFVVAGATCELRTTNVMDTPRALGGSR